MPSSSGMPYLFASGPLQAVAMRSRNARQKCECFLFNISLPIFVLRECNPGHLSVLLSSVSSTLCTHDFMPSINIQALQAALSPSLHRLS